MPAALFSFSWSGGVPLETEENGTGLRVDESGVVRQGARLALIPWETRQRDVLFEAVTEPVSILLSASALEEARPNLLRLRVPFGLVLEGANDGAIESLGELKYLVSLVASDSPIRSIAALERLPWLRHLDVHGTQIERLGTFSPFVDEIDAHQTSLVEIESLPRSLRSLDLSSTPLESRMLPPLPSALEILRLANTNIDELPQINALFVLEELDLSKTRLERAEGMCASPALRMLSLGGTGLRDIRALQECSSLETLDLSDTRIENVSAAGSLVRLRTLDLTRSAVTDLIPLSDLRSLEKLSLAETHVRDWEPLRFLASLKVLDLESSGIGDADLRALSQLRLLELNLSRTRVSDAGLDALPSSLRVLDLRGLRISDEGLQKIATFRELQEIDLGRTDIQSLTPLCENSVLRRLRLRETRIDSVDLEVLSECAPPLSELGLRGTAIDSDALPNISLFHSLTRLDLCETSIDDASLTALAELPLATLSLCGSALDGSGFEALVELPLRVLDVSSTEFRDQHLHFLAAFQTLRVLSLRDTAVAGDGLASLRHLEALEELDLGETALGPGTLSTISALPQLHTLSLRMSRVRDGDMRDVARLPRLRNLDIAYTAVTREGVAVLGPLALKRLEIEMTPAIASEPTRALRR